MVHVKTSSGHERVQMRTGPGLGPGVGVETWKTNGSVGRRSAAVDDVGLRDTVVVGRVNAAEPRFGVGLAAVSVDGAKGEGPVDAMGRPVVAVGDVSPLSRGAVHRRRGRGCGGQPPERHLRRDGSPLRFACPCPCSALRDARPGGATEPLGHQ